MKYPLFLKWHILRWLLIIVTAIIFAGGLIYNHSLSRLTTTNLTEVREKTYPILQIVDLLRLRFKLIQDKFSEAVIVGDESRVSLARREASEFLFLLDQLNFLIKDPQTLISIQATFEEYLKLADEISRYLIQHHNETAFIQDRIMEFNKKGQLLTEEMEKLAQESQLHLNARLDESQKNSELMMRVGLWSSIAAILLFGGIATLIVNLNRRLALSNQNLEGLVKARTHELEAFVYTISHDLKSPVVSMQGMASMFLEDYGNKVDEKGRHYLDRIMANANYMEELINDLLTLSRIGRRQENPQMADLHEILKEILDIHKEHFKEKSIEVIVQPSLPHFKFERVHLTHLFQNLITNAAKFMGNQPHPRIEIGGREDGDGLEFYVKDNGIGIDPEYHEKIFGIFQRLREVEVEGTGVGLSIVKKIMDMAGGKIWVESRKGEGATLFVRLPRKGSQRRQS